MDDPRISAGENPVLEEDRRPGVKWLSLNAGNSHHLEHIAILSNHLMLLVEEPVLGADSLHGLEGVGDG